MPNLQNLDGIDFDSLANISGSTPAWWRLSWDTLDEIELYVESIEERRDEMWAFIVKVVLNTGVPPTCVVDALLQLFDLESISQHLQRL